MKLNLKFIPFGIDSGRLEYSPLFWVFPNKDQGDESRLSLARARRDFNLSGDDDGDDEARSYWETCPHETKLKRGNQSFPGSTTRVSVWAWEN